MKNLVGAFVLALLATPLGASTYYILPYSVTTETGNYVAGGGAPPPRLRLSGTITFDDLATGLVTESDVTAWSFDITGSYGSMTISSNNAAGGLTHLEGTFNLNGFFMSVQSLHATNQYTQWSDDKTTLDHVRGLATHNAPAKYGFNEASHFSYHTWSEACDVPETRPTCDYRSGGYSAGEWGLNPAAQAGRTMWGFRTAQVTNPAPTARAASFQASPRVASVPVPAAFFLLASAFGLGFFRRWIGARLA